jgi:dipeptidyl aminopeptidase/acylaminoacyl peptidase
MRLSALRSSALAAALFAVPTLVAAQGTAADYRRADSLRSRFQGLVVNVAEQPTWLAGTSRLVYRKSVRGGSEFVMVDATTGQKRPAFDHTRLATALATATSGQYTPITIPGNLNFVEGDTAVEVAVDSVRWRCGLGEYVCTRAVARPGAEGRGGGPGGRGQGAGPAIPGLPTPPPPPRLSPDGKTEAFVRNYNVWIRPVADRSKAVALSFDGSEGNAYVVQNGAWSPDSKKLAVYKVRPGYRRQVHYVESSPEDQLQPEHTYRDYLKPGDVLDTEQPVLFNVETKQQFIVDNALFPNAYDMTPINWWRDSRGFRFDYNQRGHQAYRIIDVDAATGTPRAMVNEESKTFFNYSGKRHATFVGDGQEVVWMSERDGWNHLYLYDGTTGQVKNQITKGEWVVRAVSRVDTTRRQIWFTASGMNRGQDPYFIHHYRINFDGTGLTPFTEADGTHTVTFSPDSQYYVDSWSRVDMAPIAQLRRTSDQKVVMELERGDLTALVKAGWRAPEVFTAMGRDGKTPIWGVIIRPTNFDPKKKYPVIEDIYAGPQDSFVPKNFSVTGQMQAQAEIGFIVVQVDGMGTSNRSKAFHDVAWKNLGDAGFPDRIRWHKAIAAKYPWYDISRVGIYGTSAGGQSSLGGLLFHPEFYKVAVSAAGCHDNRMDKIWWNELWMGWPVGPHYAEQSNVTNAHKLQGKLLLMVGEMDTNVDPASTLQVVNALIKSNKMFDLLFIPGAGHTSGGAYGEKKRFDYFVHNLLGVEPPERNVMAVAMP